MKPQFPYRRIADDLRARIESGEFEVEGHDEQQLPSRAKLAEEYGVADMTIGRALRVLMDEDLIFGVAGLGVFVR
jgi:GntR family transcriptional regulator